ncbi:MAG: hypothetical protein JO180_03400 [Gemmatirosa sp.]|nr:hypothetical protein [Gemmatirosa sp.]
MAKQRDESDRNRDARGGSDATDRQRDAGARQKGSPGNAFDDASAERSTPDRGSAFDAGEDDFDGDSPLGGERREPGR